MAQQNINQYNFKKWYVKSVPRLFDMSIASDEKSFNEDSNDDLAYDLIAKKFF